MGETAISDVIYDNVTVLVRTPDGRSTVWHVLGELVDRDYRMALVDADGRRIEAIGYDLYDCLQQIRRQLDPAGILLCCNGARKNARPSGYLSDTLGGTNVYLDWRWRGGLPRDLVELLDYAPPRKIATVEEQENYLRRVDDYQRSFLPILNPLQWAAFGYRTLHGWLRRVLWRRRERRSSAS